MKFLANENVPFPSIRILQAAGHNVVSVSTIAKGIKDERVITKAIEESLIILTFDRDYGTLIFKFHHDPPPAVVYFRFRGSDPTYAARTLLSRMEDNSLSLEGYFTVIEELATRQRKLTDW